MLTQDEPQAVPAILVKDHTVRPVHFCGHERAGLGLAREACARAGMFAGLSAEQVAQVVRCEAFRPDAMEAWASIARPQGALLVLVYAPPWWAVEPGVDPNSEIGAAQLADWQRCNAELFRLAVKNPDSCRLVNVLSAIHAPKVLAAHVADALGVDLVDAGVAEAVDRGPFQALALHLADIGLPGNHPARSLYAELGSIATLDPEPLGLVELEVAATIGEYNAVCDALRDSARASKDQRDVSLANELLEIQVRQLREELDVKSRDSQAALELAEARAEALADALDARASELASLQLAFDRANELHAQQSRLAEQQRLAAEASSAEYLSQISARQESLRNEGELLLLQLHQAQEELESVYLKSQADASAHKVALDQLAHERDAVAMQLAHVSAQSADHSRELQEKIEHVNLELQKSREALESLTAQTVQNQAAYSKLRTEYELNQLYLLQLREELSYHVEQNESLHIRLSKAGEARDMLALLWKTNQPADVTLDLRGSIDGTNWHEPESDGRWTGPLERSLLRLPAMRPGQYCIQLDIVDAISDAALSGLRLTLNEVPVPLLIEGSSFPCLVLGNVLVEPSDETERTLILDVAQTASPQSMGVDDPRLLGVRVRSVTFSLVERSEEASL